MTDKQPPVTNLLYHLKLIPFITQETGKLGLTIEFGPTCVTQKADGNSFIVLSQNEICDLVATFEPMFNSIDIETGTDKSN